jgi:hypothetical protein
VGRGGGRSRGRRDVPDDTHLLPGDVARAKEALADYLARDDKNTDTPDTRRDTCEP